MIHSNIKHFSFISNNILNPKHRNFKLFRYFLISTSLLISLQSCDPEKEIPKEDPDITDTIPTETKIKIDFYDIASLPEIFVEISTEEWNNLLSFYDQNPNNEEYIKCSFQIKNEKTSRNLSNCGLRLRGNTSRRRPEGTKNEAHKAVNPDWHHASFSVKFNKFEIGQDISGVEKINLKWFKDDAMYVREVYCYDLFERYGVWTAPQSSYCRLKLKIKEDIDTVYYGVYEILEPVDNDYIKSRDKQYGNATGFLWKANWGADLKSANTSLMGIENVSLTGTYTPVYDFKSDVVNFDFAKYQLVDFITNLNNKTGDDFKTWINMKMDVPLFLKTYAVSVLCGMWDDYWINKNNFYFYFNGEGKFFFIPFDYDNTLGTSQIITDAGKQDVLNWGNSSYPLITKIINIPEYKALYISYIRELCSNQNNYFEYSKSTARIRNWQNLIKNYISNDTGEDMKIEDKPASWGNCDFYRLLETNNNYFIIRASNIPK
ncbi:MAG TPA: CotH kinase family protein [Paludibacter sp.]|nr:CotH kinase family protein [Paludibacter sp.]